MKAYRHWTHRHYGLDFWLISQGPHLFHNFIRLLVSRHIHLVARWSGRIEEVHTKQDKRKPLSFYATIGALVLAVAMSAFVVQRIQSRIAPPEQASIAPAAGGAASSRAAWC